MTVIFVILLLATAGLSLSGFGPLLRIARRQGQATSPVNVLEPVNFWRLTAAGIAAIASFVLPLLDVFRG